VFRVLRLTGQYRTHIHLDFPPPGAWPIEVGGENLEERVAFSPFQRDWSLMLHREGRASLVLATSVCNAWTADHSAG
jgi:hypothetical protein